MPSLRIFISSVQDEFAEERAALRDHIRDEPLVRRFFDASRIEVALASE